MFFTRLRGIFGNFESQISPDGELLFSSKNQFVSVPMLRLKFEKTQAYLIRFQSFPFGCPEASPVLRIFWENDKKRLEIFIHTSKGMEEIAPEEFRDALAKADLPVIVTLPRYSIYDDSDCIEREMKWLLSDLIKKGKVYLDPF